MTDLCAATHTKPGSENVHRCTEPDDHPGVHRCVCWLAWTDDTEGTR